MNNNKLLSQKKIIIALIFYLCSSTSLLATDFYWSGATNNNWGNPGNWADANGVGLAAVPTVSDNVFILETNYTAPQTINIDGTVQCKNLTVDVTSLTTITGSNSPSLSIYGNYTGDGDASIPVNVIFRAGNTQHTITMNGSCFGDFLTFSGTDGTWEFMDDFNCGSTIVSHSRGNLILGANTFSMKRFYSSNTNVRSLDISNSIMNIQQGYGVNGYHSWDMEETSNLTFTSTDSEIHLNDDNTAVHFQSSFASGSLEYNKVFFHNVNSTSNLSGDGATFNELHLDGGLFFNGNNIVVGGLYMAGGKTYKFISNNMLQILDYWQIAGKCSQYTTLTSTLSGQDAYIDFSGGQGGMNLEYFIVESVEMTGLSYTGSGRMVNVLNSNGWPATNISSQNFYWVGGTGNWSDADHWSIGVSGGAGNGNCLPGPLDNVIFDGASLNNGESCTLDIPSAYAHTMDWTAASAGAIFISTYYSNSLSLYGSLLLSGSINFSHNGYVKMKYIKDLGNYTSYIETNGNNLNCIVSLDGQYGVYELADDFHSTNYFYVNAGTFDTRSNYMASAHFRSLVRNERTINLGNSLIDIAGTWAVAALFKNGTNTNTLALNEGNSTIRMLNHGFEAGGDIGETYWNVELLDPNGTAQVNGSTTFNDLIFYGNGGIAGNATINNTLYFSPGKSYSLSNTVTIAPGGNLDAVGTCTDYILISNGKFSKTSGNISVEYAIITDNEAAGGANFTADQSTLTGNTGAWNSIPGNSQDFHFKATVSENWGDAQNWYYDNTFINQTNCLPGPENDVYFYENSFDATYPNLVIDELNPLCHSMEWMSGSYSTTPTVTATNTNNHLRIYGSIYLLDNTHMDWQFNGGLSFTSNDATPHHIESSGQVYHGGTTFYGTDQAEWYLNDAFESAAMNVVQGRLNSNAVNITTGYITSKGYRTRILDFTGSVINVVTSTGGGQSYAWVTTYQINSSALTVIMDGSELHLNHVNNYDAWLLASNVDFNKIYFHSDNGRLSGDGLSFQLAEFDGNGSINGNSEFHILRLSPGKSYSFQEGSTQSIVPDVNGSPGTFDATGTVGTGKININSSALGTHANIEQVTGEICVDHLNLTDMAVTQPGAGTLAYAGQNSVNISNNTGWAFDGCNSTVVQGCAGFDVYFNILVNGTSFSWKFGDNQTGTGSPIQHAYASPGTYSAYVIISTFHQGNYTEDGRNFEVVITQSCCSTATNIKYVDTDATNGLNDGSDWANAYLTIQQATATAIAGDEIWVAEGTYYPSVNNNPAEYITLPSDVEMYGGFDGTESCRFQRDWNAHLTIIDGNIGNPSISTDNSWWLLKHSLATGLVIDGFILQNGYTTSSSAYENIYFSSASATLSNLIIRNNYSSRNGVFITHGASNITVINSLITSNEGRHGVLAYNTSSSSSFNFINCTFAQNTVNSTSCIGPNIFFENSIVYLSGNAGSQATFNYCVVDFTANSGTNTLSNTNPDLDGNYCPNSTSPVIDAGDNALNTEIYDLRKELRVVDGTIDIGAYEYNSLVPRLKAPESETYSELSQIRVFPNPSRDFFNLDFEATKYSYVKVQNMSGKIIHEVQLTNEDTQVLLNLANEPSGIYLITVVGDREFNTIKVSKL